MIWVCAISNVYKNCKGVYEIEWLWQYLYDEIDKEKNEKNNMGVKLWVHVQILEYLWISY